MKHGTVRVNAQKVLQELASALKSVPTTSIAKTCGLEYHAAKDACELLRYQGYASSQIRMVPWEHRSGRRRIAFWRLTDKGREHLQGNGKCEGGPCIAK